MRFRLFVMVLLAGCASAGQAAGLEVYLSDKTAQFRFINDAGVIGLPGADMSFGLFYSDDKDYMGTVGLHAAGTPAGEHPVTFGLGGRFYAGSIDDPDQSFQALALGGEARLTIPANMPMAVVGELHFAPSVTSFGDADQLLDWGFRYELEVTPGVSGFAGYRRLTLDLDEDSNYRVDKRVHFGIRFSY
ncbi:YfaZ family outer membrane protein [Thioalkalivibrio thiocyanodenitrificans]|uniref:YfaZ family outer membrane protein n=1 Tax=Thioalkalivibrio thiocyanodenitrificans TaxID=243063 RepID=UPI0003738C47|nr:YfaZ family outer membrane protein [Thioalkalivibrio thiocyanodenitrificans]